MSIDGEMAGDPVIGNKHNDTIAGNTRHDNGH